MPSDLSATAQAFWHLVVADCLAAGTVAKCDGLILRRAAESYELYVEAHAEVVRLGVLISEERATKFGTYTVRKRNPACEARSVAWREIVSVLTQFGLSPSSRTKVEALGAPSGDEADAAQYLGFSVQ